MQGEVAHSPGRKISTRRLPVTIPTAVKRILCIPSSAKTIQQAVESQPEVQAAIQKLELREGVSESCCAVSKVRGGGTQGVPHYLLQERNRRIVELHQMGLTPETIRKYVNSRAEVTGWGEITWEGSISRIVSTYFQNQRPSARELEAHEEGMRDAMFSSMSVLIEQMALHIAKRNQAGDWAKFEYAAAMGTLFRMHQTLVDDRNWNASKINPHQAIQRNNINILMFDTEAQKVIANKRLLQPVINLLDECLAQSTEANNH
ncbi:MAG: hypothetical protein Q7S29_00165 [Candidatus Peribacter sp.]|nr:hypothetical protein [Candidatus Peribacter sp.]